MHEQSPILEAVKRDRLGSRYARRERAAGRMPAVLYGHGQEPVALSVDAKATLAYIHKGEKVFRINLSGESAEQTVLLRDVQFDHLGTQIVHCDFARVNLDERVQTTVTLHLVGEAIGLKTAGTLMMHPVTEIEIECRVADLPDFIEVDITNLDVGHAITAGDVALPRPDMKLITDADAIVAQVAHGGASTAAEAEAVSAEATAPEVIGEKERKEKEEADKAGKK